MPIPTRRDRLRTATIVEIKQAAWLELQSSGLQDLSLRGVARRLGMAPSALYRYFDSRDDLLSALIIEAYLALADDLEASYQLASARPKVRAREVFLEVARRYRSWAQSHVLEYNLIFGSTIPGYTGTEQTTLASMRSSGVLLKIMADLVHQDGLDTKAWGAQLTADLRERLTAWSDSLDEPLPPEALLAALSCYATLHGAINIELYSHLPPSIGGSEDLFVATINRSLDGVQSG